MVMNCNILNMRAGWDAEKRPTPVVVPVGKPMNEHDFEGPGRGSTVAKLNRMRDINTSEPE